MRQKRQGSAAVELCLKVLIFIPNQSRADRFFQFDIIVEALLMVKTGKNATHRVYK